MYRSSILAFFLAVSIFGLVVIMASLLFPPNVSENIPMRKPLVGIIFGSICIAGMIAVVFPGPCSRSISFGGEKPAKSAFKKPRVSSKKFFIGHHPNCGKFFPHVLRTGDKTICAGCAGLFLGGFMALIGSLLYFFGNFQIGQNIFLLAWVGAACVTLGIVQPLFFSPQRSSIRSLINALFALGAFLILIVADGITQSIYLDLFLLLLVLFWLLTKISISRWSHYEICRRCGVANCELRGF